MVRDSRGRRCQMQRRKRGRLTILEFNPARACVSVRLHTCLTSPPTACLSVARKDRESTPNRRGARENASGMLPKLPCTDMMWSATPLNKICRNRFPALTFNFICGTARWLHSSTTKHPSNFSQNIRNRLQNGTSSALVSCKLQPLA